MATLRLTQIWIYPIKSLGGIRASTATVMGKGLQYDRRWMLVDKDGICITQRTNPEMALFTLQLMADGIKISHLTDAIFLPIHHPPVSALRPVQIWDDVVSAAEVSIEHSRWFSERLGLECQLVHFPEECARPVDPKYKVNDEHVSLADAYPFLIIGQSSLDDLNNRLTVPVPINRFRPNFVFTGGLPYEEDHWGNFTIGSTRFAGVKQCARCVLTTVNHETGKKGVEPLRTLATYRNFSGKIHFGQNLVALGDGTVTVGEPLLIENGKN